MKQCCLFNQVIVINDNQTSNLPSIYVKCIQVKHTGEMGKWEGKRNREQQIRGEREAALVRNGIGVGQKWPLVKQNT